jgi:hypothetical protein
MWGDSMNTKVKLNEVIGKLQANLDEVETVHLDEDEQEGVTFLQTLINELKEIEGELT